MLSGSERRFLVPPPTAILLGASWWTHLPTPYVAERKVDHNIDQKLQIFAPSLQVEVSQGGEEKQAKDNKETFVEWVSYDGHIFNQDIASADVFPVAGRVVGKDLYTPDLKDDRNEKSDKDKQLAHAVISVISPGLGTEKDRTIGNFTSKPIKIISKPSKKIQSYRKGARKFLRDHFRFKRRRMTLPESRSCISW